YPLANIMRVDGTGGDEGIDNFQGNLSDGPGVWQDKHFPNRIQKAQRKQILKSIKAAFKARTPRHWVLCVPINLRTTEHNWFQNSVKSAYERKHPGTTIDLMQASHIVRDLFHFKTVREAFFPDAVSDIAKLKALVMNTDALSVDECGTITAEYAQQYLINMKALDPRCHYELSIGGERAPKPNPEPGLLLAFRRGDLLTRVFARDIDAIRLDPITFQLKLQPSAGEKIRQAAETGRPQILLPGEVLSISSESPLMAFLNRDLRQPGMEIVPQVPDPTKLIPLRFVFGQGSDVKEINYLPFRQEYVGQREVTLRSCSQLPVEVRMIFHLDKGATINIAPVFTGANVCNLQHVIDCMTTLKVSPFIEVSSVEFGVPILAGEVPFSAATGIEPGLLDVITDAALISKHFGVALKLPDKITDDDLQALLELKRIATGEVFDVEKIHFSFAKDGDEKVDVIMASGPSPGSLLVVPNSDLDPVAVFGVAIKVGRPIFQCERVTLDDVPEAQRRYMAAKPGGEFPVTWKCLGKCRFISGQARDALLASVEVSDPGQIIDNTGEGPPPARD
ncbi:MAG: hypothetical protein WBQ76_02395, partial [Candidatus Korobacteraceae bacterium]